MLSISSIIKSKTILQVGLILLAGGLFWGYNLSLHAKQSSEGNILTARGTQGTGNSGKGSGNLQEISQFDPSTLETAEVEVVQMTQTIRVNGELVADEVSDIACRTGGIVEEVLVDKGSEVRKGDLLVRLDPSDAINELEEGQVMADELKARLVLEESTEAFVVENQDAVKTAKAALVLAESNYKRNAELYSKSVLPEAEFDQVKNTFDLALVRYEQSRHEAQALYQSYRKALVRVKILKKTLEDTRIIAPFDGYVAEKFVSVGENVSTNGPGKESTVVRLVRLDPIRLSLTIPQQNLGLVHAGQKVTFQVDSYPDRTFVGHVKYISPMLSSESRSLQVEALVENKDHPLHPGLYVNAEIEVPGQITSYRIPASAVKKDGEVSRVCVVREGRIEERIVSTGDTEQEKITVVKGLNPGERVVADIETLGSEKRVNP